MRSFWKLWSGFMAQGLRFGVEGFCRFVGENLRETVFYNGRIILGPGMLTNYREVSLTDL